MKIPLKIASILPHQHNMLTVSNIFPHLSIVIVLPTPKQF